MAANASLAAFTRTATSISKLFHSRHYKSFCCHKNATTVKRFVRCFASLKDILQQPENLPPKVAEVPHSDSNHVSEHIFSSYRQESVVRASRAETNDPVLHGVEDLSKFYTLDKDVISSLALQKISRQDFTARSHAFQECALMVREPALECLELIKCAVHPDLISSKAVLYGKNGCGKSLTFAHVLNACYNKNWFIVSPLKPNVWRFHYKEVALSTRKTGRVDLPLEAVDFLSHIKHTNKNVFEKFGSQMRTHDTYVWSKREETPSNTLLEELIEYGIERPKYSADVLGVLLKEVRLYSHEWPTSTVLAIDGVNGFFGATNLFVDREKKQSLLPTGISMVHNLVKLISSEWKNGFMLLTVDTNYEHADHRQSHHPRYLLNEAGFDILNPFIPIEVSDYNEEEVHSALDYFIEHRWIQNESYRTSRQAREELIFLSGKNPLFLDKAIRSI
ncbi:small ribosomal subunit protein mS29-like [Watersipora subatra]|uniref:small ribosomal subunit protein mS29-like n=1 Tax=Watersipora subatra TaxID=2589382 RepID=UPI00355C8888